MSSRSMASLPTCLFGLTLVACTGNPSAGSPPAGAAEDGGFTSDVNGSIENPRSSAAGRDAGAPRDAGPDAVAVDAASASPAPSTAPTDAGLGEGASSPVPIEQVPDATWRACSSGRCATVQVPLDYANPNLGTIDLEVFVGRAESTREGVLFFNPGGPGVPVVGDADLYHAWLGELFPHLDIVLMDNRGVGESTPVDCVGRTALDAAFTALGDEWSIPVLDEFGRFWGEFDDGCSRHLGAQVVPSLYTANVARDMNSVRLLLGEEQLNVWNVSYGTVQASEFVRLFPDRVRAFVLDSPVYLGQANLVDDILGAIASYDHELTRFLAWCAAGASCGLGATQDEVDSNYDELRRSLIGGTEVSGGWIDQFTFDNAVAGALMYGEWERLAATLSDAMAGDWDMLLESEDGSDADSSHALLQANLVVRSLDYGCPKDYTAEQALRIIEGAVEEYPRMAELYAWHFGICLGWKTSAREARVQPADLTGPPLLLLTSAHDPATPVDGARLLLQQINNGSNLLVVDKDGHGVLGSDGPGTAKGVEFVESLSSPREQCSGLGCLQPYRRVNALPSGWRAPKLPFISPRPVLRTSAERQR